MPVYLAEEQAGSDPQVIGFPNIRLCMGVVLQTKAHLYGFHFSGLSKTEKYAQDFLADLKKMGGDTENGVHLYGSCIRVNRYGGSASASQKAWKADMKLIAKVLGYSGPISGFDSEILSRKSNSSYIEYRANFAQGTCKIFHADGADVKDDAIQRRNAPKEVLSVNLGVTRPFISTNFSTTGGASMMEIDPMTQVDYFLRTESGW